MHICKYLENSKDHVFWFKKYYGAFSVLFTFKEAGRISDEKEHSGQLLLKVIGGLLQNSYENTCAGRQPFSEINSVNNLIVNNLIWSAWSLSNDQ